MDDVLFSKIASVSPSLQWPLLKYAITNQTVDANLGQHTRTLERASRKGTEEQQGHTDRLDRLSKSVRPVSRVSLESVVSRDKYHTYVVKSGKVYEQTSKG